MIPYTLHEARDCLADIKEHKLELGNRNLTAEANLLTAEVLINIWEQLQRLTDLLIQPAIHKHPPAQPREPT